MDTRFGHRSEHLFLILRSCCRLSAVWHHRCDDNVDADESISAWQSNRSGHWVGLFIRCASERLLSAADPVAFCAAVLLSWWDLAHVWKCVCSHVLIFVYNVNISIRFQGLINHDWFVSRLLGNTIWLMALGYYVNITFLGYNCKSTCAIHWAIDIQRLISYSIYIGIAFLKNTRLILAPLTLIALVYIMTLIMSWNVTQTFMNFYHYRVL